MNPEYGGRLHYANALPRHQPNGGALIGQPLSRVAARRVEYGQLVEAPTRLGQLDHAWRHALPCPHLLDRMNLAVADLQDRLDAEHCAEQRPHPADPSTLLQVAQRL